MKKITLGKGLQSLIPTKSQIVEPEGSNKDSVFYIEVNRIKPNSNQPRQDFNKEGIRELAQSIRKYGVLQPLLVTKREVEAKGGLGVEYTLIAGERRLRASKEAGLFHVPVIVKDIMPLENRASLEIALIENIQRENLNSIEEAEAFSRLKNEFGLSYDKIASQVGRSPQAINNTIRLLELPDYIKGAVREQKIAMGHARALLSIKDETKQREAYSTVLTQSVSVRDVEQLARESGVKAKPRHKDKKFKDLEQNLSKKLNTAVNIKVEEDSKGKITARFTDHKQLNEIVKAILD